MKTLKILVVSQKGGVGKSTFSTNFAAWSGEVKQQSTVLLDFDPHASSSTWLKELEPKNVVVMEASTSDFSAQRWYMGARTMMRKVESTCDVAIADVTWTKGMNYDFLAEFDLVLVPTSVSKIDVEATHEFILQNLNSFKEQPSSLNKKMIPPELMLLPSMVTEEQLNTNPFTTKNFDFRFLLLPPIPYDVNVRLLFRKQFIHQSLFKSKRMYEICFESIRQAGKVHIKEKLARIKQLQLPLKIENIRGNFALPVLKNQKIWATKMNFKNSGNIGRIINSEVKRNKTINKKKSWLEKISSW